MSGYGLRRPPVNVVGSGNSSSSTYDEESNTSKKFCPREGRLLIFREDINSFFCPECAYKPPLPQLKLQETEQEPQESQEEEDPPLSTVDGLQTKIGQRGTTLEEDFDSAIRIRPIANSGRRSDQLQKDAGRRGIHGLDNDLEMLLDKPGMNLVYSSEEMSDDRATYNSQDMINRRRGKF